MAYDPNNIFAKILGGQIPSVVHEHVHKSSQRLRGKKGAL